MGIHETMGNAEYHRTEAVGKSDLDLIAKSPAHYRFAKDHPELRTETPSMTKGTLVHALVLEPEKVRDWYVVMPEHIKQRRGKDWEAFKASAGDRNILKADEYADAQRIAEAVTSNPIALQILEEADAFEQSVFCEEFETGLLCKCRPDILMGRHIYDLKTTSNAAARSFSYSARQFRYHVQASFYMDVCRWAGLEVDRFGFIAVDTQDRPYQATVFHQLANEAVEQGRALYMDDLRTLARAVETDEWPGYPSEYEVLTLAGYAFDLTEVEAA